MSLNGIVQKIAWVDLNKREVKIEEPDDDIYINYLGGYGLGAYYLFTRQPAKADALGPDNTLGLITGPLRDPGYHREQVLCRRKISKDRRLG